MHRHSRFAKSIDGVISGFFPDFDGCGDKVDRRAWSENTGNRDHDRVRPAIDEGTSMFYLVQERRIVGPAGELLVPDDDEITPRLLMLIEGNCEGLGPAQAAQKYGLSRQRYFQILQQFREHGALALLNQKVGPKTRSVRTEDVERRVIRHRFLDPDATVAAIAQKVRQSGLPISNRSVNRIVEQYGLHKKSRSRPARS
jgi:transposase